MWIDNKEHGGGMAIVITVFVKMANLAKSGNQETQVRKITQK